MDEHAEIKEIPEFNSEEAFRLISELHGAPNLTQRQLSKNLNISLGKTNYLLKELVKKGIIKVKNFSGNPDKLKKVQYILTAKGLQEKLKLTYHFLKRKEAEYNHIKKEWEKLIASNLEKKEVKNVE